jgi:hypothetical protein
MLNSSGLGLIILIASIAAERDQRQYFGFSR